MFWQQHRKQTNQEWKKRCCNLHSHWPDSTLNNKMLLDMTTHVVLRKFGIFKAQKTNPKNFISKVRLTIFVFFLESEAPSDMNRYYTLNSAVTTLACNAVFCPKGCARLVCRQALGLAHPQPPDKVSGWLRVGVKKFSKENNMYEVATIVIERNHCFKSTCLTFKPVS